MSLKSTTAIDGNETKEILESPPQLNTNKSIDTPLINNNSNLINYNELIQKSCQNVSHPHAIKFNQHPNNCSQYYVCHNFQATIFTCTFGHYFDTDYQSCVSFRKPCGSITLEYNNSGNDSVTGYMTDSMPCDSYVKYSLVKNENLNCESGQHFDVMKLMCVN